MNPFKLAISIDRGNVLIAMALSALLLTACSGSGNSSNNKQVDPLVPEPVVTVAGGITKGPVNGATVSVFAVDSNGVKIGVAIATTTTDANGQYTVELGNFSGVYIVEATGGSYVDETTGQEKSIPADKPLRAVSSVDSPTADVAITVTVTPLTEIAVQVTEQKTGGLTTSNVTESNNEVGSLFFGGSTGAGEKLLTTQPADVTNEDSSTATDAERLYGLLLGTLTTLQTELGSLEEVTEAIANDIAADGKLGDLSDSLIAASAEFIAGDTNNSGVTSATVLNNILTAATSGVGSEIVPSSDASMTAFVFTDSLSTDINDRDSTVQVLMPAGTDLSLLSSPEIGSSLGSTVAPNNGEDFSSTVSYIVTAEDTTTTREWLVTVIEAETGLSPLAEITAASHELIANGIINRSLKTFIGNVASFADLQTLDEVADISLLFAVSAGANIVQVAGSFAEGDVIYAITAEDGATIAEWEVLLRVNNPQQQTDFQFAAIDLVLLINDEPVQLTTTGGQSGVTTMFESSDTSVVVVNSESGVLTVQGPGTAAITATIPGVTTPIAVLLPATATISVSVTKVIQENLVFENTAITSPLNTTVVNDVSGGGGTGAVTYTTGDASIATVSSDGLITLLKTGSTTITAVKSGDSIFLDSDPATFSLTVTDVIIQDCVLDQSNWDECNWQ